MHRDPHGMSQKVTSDTVKQLTPAGSGSFRKEAFKMMRLLDSQECEVAATCDSCTAGGLTKSQVNCQGIFQEMDLQRNSTQGSLWEEGQGESGCSGQWPAESQPTDLRIS